MKVNTADAGSQEAVKAAPRKECAHLTKLYVLCKKLLDNMYKRAVLHTSVESSLKICATGQNYWPANGACQPIYEGTMPRSDPRVGK